jgi:hypothetical protein
MTSGGCLSHIYRKHPPLAREQALTGLVIALAAVPSFGGTRFPVLAINFSAAWSTEAKVVPVGQVPAWSPPAEIGPLGVVLA